MSRLLSPEVYDAFSEAIGEREERGQEAMETLFSRIEPEIVEARIEGGADGGVHPLHSESFRLPCRPAGLLFRNVSIPLQGKDVGTFGRSLTPRHAGWRVVATRTED